MMFFHHDRPYLGFLGGGQYKNLNVKRVVSLLARDPCLKSIFISLVDLLVLCPKC